MPPRGSGAIARPIAAQGGSFSARKPSVPPGVSDRIDGTPDFTRFYATVSLSLRRAALSAGVVQAQALRVRTPTTVVMTTAIARRSAVDELWRHARHPRPARIERHRRWSGRQGRHRGRQPPSIDQRRESAALRRRRDRRRHGRHRPATPDPRAGEGQGGADVELRVWSVDRRRPSR